MPTPDAWYEESERLRLWQMELDLALRQREKVDEIWRELLENVELTQEPE